MTGVFLFNKNTIPLKQLHFTIVCDIDVIHITVTTTIRTIIIHFSVVTTTINTIDRIFNTAILCSIGKDEIGELV